MWTRNIDGIQFPLNEFEQYIDETILKRGLSYFEKGNIQEVEELGGGEYEAVVEGTETYTVRLKLKKGIITRYDCDCPYDLGPICKHVVGVIFYMQQSQLNLDEQPKRKKRVAVQKTKSKKAQVKEILEKVSHKELKQFLLDNITGNPALGNLLITSFPQYNQEQSKAHFTALIKSILKSERGRDHFIDWSAARRVGMAMVNLLNMADRHIVHQQYTQGIYIYTAIMEELTGALQYSDDSNGDIGGNIDYAYQMLLGLVTEEAIPEEIRTMLFNYAIQAFRERFFDGWDWHMEMLKMAVFLSKTKPELDLVFKLLEKKPPSEYEEKQIEIFTYSLLIKTRGEKAAEDYLNQHLLNPVLRKIAIDKALDKKDFEKAIQLTQDGMKRDKKARPGLVREGQIQLMEIAQIQGNKKDIIKYARPLFLESFHNERDFYQILKEQIPENEWHSFVEEMISEIKSGRSWVNRNLLAEIYINEECWDRLFLLVKEQPDLRQLDHFEKYLQKDYQKEITELYGQAILNYLRNNVGRRHYQTACNYLRKIIKLGNEERAVEIISHLKAKYPKRKALLEELNRV
ncbi:SWIM zinc finger family protein [Flexithrix dorotheae]|uniref:SWIM zinc finger family protein n=1 Tax=Flexithrix dorotheae TaxID=70993 RepID=UPI000372BB2F|nr:SWIM zinc finger family protein [Flexithrix dorotheae]